MHHLSRRTFVALTAALPGAAAHHTTRRSSAPIPTGPLNPETLLALGQAILPTELTPDGISRVVGAFQVWLNQYAGQAELVHGYGTGEIEYTPPNPTERWNAQLAELESTADQRGGISFSELAEPQRREVVASILNATNADRLPTPSRAEHVAVGLLAYYYDTPEATDLCYRAQIAKTTCRALDDTTRRPAPYSPGTARGGS